MDLIVQTKKLGFTIAEIQEMLRGYDLESDEPLGQALPPDRISQHIALLERQREEIEVAIRMLRDLLAGRM
ncbi:MerR family DNA-binding protein [Methyloferula stellata]|uniref:MerR family DNA-binding protein n=1 Tax=Methyloferula stellata TaxID=876270 RepID=UPI000A075C68